MNEQNAVATISPQPKPSALGLMASRLSVDPAKLLSTLKNTVFRNATDDELLALVVVSNEYGLNPLLKEIYAFPAKGGGIVPIVSVDGWNKMMIRQPDFDGIEFEFTDDEKGIPTTCTAKVYFKNRSRPMILTEYMSECFRNTDNWKNMPHRMLRNRTLCQSSRWAFGFAGIYNEDEAATFTIESSIVQPKQITIATPNIPTDDGDLAPVKRTRKTLSDAGEATPPSAATTANAVATAHAPASESPSQVRTVKEDTITALIENGVSFEDFRSYLNTTGIAKDADSFGAYQELPAAIYNAVQGSTLAKIVKLYGQR